MPTFHPTRRTLLAGGLATAVVGSAPIRATAASSSAEKGWVESMISRMSLEQKVGQLFIQQVYGSDATTPDARNRPLYGVDRPADVVAKYHLGGVIYFAWTDSVAGGPTQIVACPTGSNVQP